MALVRYEPWGIGQLQSEINRLFRSFADWDSSGATAGWVPPVDIYEHGDRFQRLHERRQRVHLEARGECTQGKVARAASAHAAGADGTGM